MFVDRVEVKVKAGNGGDGLLSFRHEKFRALGGPDGGDGGHGGNVILKASRNQNTLADFRYKKQLQAKDGQAGGKRHRHGKNGENLIVAVPIGTQVIESSQAIADLTEDGQEFTLAKGGNGGFGNAHFTSSTRQAPRIAEKGESGDELSVVFELKMIADVGIVGLPNAGKSTMLSVISNAHPEIADYPFTTLRPNLGVADIDGKDSLLFADIPGLIEGASHGKGLGDEFLRHVERTSLLLHLIDVYNDDITAAYRTIRKELADYKIDLSKKPSVVALSKIEGMPQKDVDSKLKLLKKAVPKGTQVLAFSSASRQGLNELLRILAKHTAKVRAQASSEADKKELPVIGLRQPEHVWQLIKTDKGFTVTGRKIERFASRTRFGEAPAEDRLRDIMRKMGIMRELERQGIQPGDKIIIGTPAIGQIEV
jgi:GTP-binding protein